MENLSQSQNELQGIKPDYTLPATFKLPSFHLFLAQLDWLVQLLDISYDSNTCEFLSSIFLFVSALNSVR